MAPTELMAIELARRIRHQALRICSVARSSHIGSCLSVADILAELYANILQKIPADSHWPDRDRLILSKGHAAAALYAVLAECGYFPSELLDTYCQDGSPLTGHVSHAVPGVEVSTGSLGHGLSVGCGLALASQCDQFPWRVFVVLSDGELDEGSTWEAALFAGHHRLNRLTAIIDYNKIQSFGAVAEVLDLEPLAEKWRAFGWHVDEINGHDHNALHQSLTASNADLDGPHVVIAHTIKGKGVSFMENNLTWHYQSPSAEQLAAALAELNR